VVIGDAPANKDVDFIEKKKEYLKTFNEAIDFK